MPRSRSDAILDQLQRFECRNVTYVDPKGQWPMVWERARGVHVWDPEGRRYLDLTAAFGVMAAGHGNRRVVRAAQAQMDKLVHAMGDVHPHALKGELARALSRLTFERWSRSRRSRSAARTGKSLFCNSGFEAVEAGLKTAMLATGRPGVMVFEGAYHGLGYGTLSATTRDHFRKPFRKQLGGFEHVVSFPAKASELPSLEDNIRKQFRRHRIGAILVEPIQGRGGIRIPPRGFLRRLRRLSDELGAVLILDEVYTGFGRTGTWFACEHEKVVPDILCLGKALTGGFPLSVCIGQSDLMDRAWPLASGEAIHTSTYLGHPVGCAMALAQIEEIRSRQLVRQSARLGQELVDALKETGRNSTLRCSARGRGLMAGLELRLRGGRPASTEALALVKAMLGRGFILLPEGEQGHILSWTPPLTISSKHLISSVRALAREMKQRGWG